VRYKDVVKRLTDMGGQKYGLSEQEVMKLKL
jgi:hypothetical protein